MIRKNYGQIIEDDEKHWVGSGPYPMWTGGDIADLLREA
jgi:hypothetical protein